LGKSNSDWSWLVSDEVLKVSSGDIAVEEGAHVVGIRFLGKGDGDWSWLVSDKVLQVSSGDVGIEEGGNVVAV